MRSSKPQLQVFVELFWMDSMVGFDVGWKLFELRRFMEEKLVSKWQNLPFLSNPTKWYWYLNRGGTSTHMQRQDGTGTNQSGTGTTHQNRVGTDTDPSGTGTTTSCSPDFWYSSIVKLKFAHRGYRNPNK